MRVTFVQTNPRFLKVEENLAAIDRKIRNIKSDLIVLPELFNTGYNFKSRREISRVAEPIPSGPTIRRLKELSSRTGSAIVAGMAEKSGRHLYNSGVFVTPSQIGVYRKIHLFYKEKLFFSPGNLGYRVFSWKGVRIGMMICFDWFFPEPCRILAVKGADIIAHPANLVMPYCPEAMKTRCLENHVYAVTSDRVGAERGLRYIGQSQIVDPNGCVLVRASRLKEETKTVTINPRQARNKKISRFNHIFKDAGIKF